MFFVWALSPFVTRRKTFHFVVLLKRVLVVLVRAQRVGRVLASASHAAHAAAAAAPAAAPPAELLQSAFRPAAQVLCQVLRIVSFLSTQLPAPAPHCRAPESTSNAPWPVVRFVID